MGCGGWVGGNRTRLHRSVVLAVLGYDGQEGDDWRMMVNSPERDVMRCVE